MRHLAIAITLVLGACDDGSPDTCSATNDALSLVAVVVDNGTKVRAEIDFELGDRSGVPSPLHVCADETLTIQGKQPTLTEKADRVVYSVTLPADGAREITFTLDRADADTIEVTVPLPPPFVVTSPTDGQAVPRSEALVLGWEPALEGKEMRVSVEEEIGYGLCVITQPGEHHYKTRNGVAVPDSGQWTIPAGVVTSQTTTTCSAFYNLRRVERAPYPEALAQGGFLEARIVRAVEIHSVP